MSWSSGLWSGGSYTLVNNGSVLTVSNGGWVRSIGTFTRGVVDNSSGTGAAAISGLEVQLHARASSASGSPKMCVQLWLVRKTYLNLTLR